MSPALVAFYILAAIAIIAAVVIVTSSNIMHCVFFHLLALTAVGGLYIMLNADFIAGVQVLIYAGAVTTMLLFTLMLAKAKGAQPRALDNQQRGTAFVVAALFCFGLSFFVTNSNWSVKKNVDIIISTERIGLILFRTYLIPFEVISVVLLVAVIGAVVLASKEEEKGESA